MKLYRNNAIIIGICYIVSTLTGVLSVIAFGDLLTVPDSFTTLAAHENRIILGTILELLCAGAFLGVAFYVFPVLNRFSRPGGIAYVVGRSFEAVPFVVSILSTLVMLSLSKEFLLSGSTDPDLFISLGIAPRFYRHWAEIYGPLVFCGIAALPFYWLLWRHRLAPQWITMWGLISTLPYLVAGFMGFWGITSETSVIPVVLIVPFAVNEMVLAVWLIAKGFNSAAFDTAGVET